MIADPRALMHPDELRTAWRAACWAGDANTEAACLARWRELAPTLDAGALPPADGIAAVELERTVRWIDWRKHGSPDTTDRLARFAAAAGDPVEVTLAEQATATDRLRLSPGDRRLCEQVESVAKLAIGSPRQQASACLNAAWATRTVEGGQASDWSREGLARLGPVTPTSPIAERELALHLLHQSSEFLPWAEQVVVARSMLKLLAPTEHPAWRTRILHRMWLAALDHDAAAAEEALEQAVTAAVASCRGRSMWEVASGLATGVQFRGLRPADVVTKLRRLDSAAEGVADVLAAMRIKSYLVEMLARTNDDRGTVAAGQPALDQLQLLSAGAADEQTRREWDALWAGIAGHVAHAAGDLNEHARAAALTEHAVSIMASQDHPVLAALTALELAEHRQNAGDLDGALRALNEAVVLAGREGDLDVTARAHARIPLAVWAKDGALAALSACDTADHAVAQLLKELDRVAPNDRVERGLVVWEAMDLKRVRAEILADSGGLRQAVEALSGVADRFLGYGYAPQAAEVLMIEGHYLAALGSGDDACARWERAATLAKAYGEKWIQQEAVSVWADWLERHGRAADAQAVQTTWSADA